MKPLNVIAAAAALSVLAAGVAGAQAPTVIEVKLVNFHFSPATIELNRGQPYVLHVTNAAGGGHSLTARKFFETVSLANGAAARVKDGEVEVAGGETADVAFTPNTAGSYEMHCDHPLHSMLGMKGQIVVH